MTKTRQLNGTVLRIERSSIHDGQGLRTVLFLKGCPLRCIWCSTPESQNPVPEKGYAKERCRECGLCVEACPAGALSLDGESGGLQINREKCRGCFACVDKCPSGALKRYGYSMSVEQAVAEVSRDEIFFFHSGGGVTISGGEPLSQARFTAAVLRECKRLGIHTAIETCLFAPWEDVKMALPWLDVLYADIKVMDGALHKKLTGADNTLILENLRRADASPYNIEIIARVPMIPGITDTGENLSETVRFLRQVKKLKDIELLPYHRLGTDTYKHLGREYSLKGLFPPTQERIAERRRFLAKLME
ncbi:MAG: glycyl-radical enzyme activating protein [Bacillota bacterium]|nr:glycyl-radical enzyme activating protein [Bacillota bacterium]MDD3297422.1 glycyl-radical enzyme activating protein [Bacillota bacterium]MDD3850234.1 glycyl-radical enzyme activating protein [Bacillota bacterium]MDD4707191.1 glycyl-radical enzyme activating protein [Bacillota bacterium]